MIEFSSPSRGSYISTCNRQPRIGQRVVVLVPFPGFLYLYQATEISRLYHNLSSRPLPGVLISLQKTERN